jgi:quercetin dioxygenase-like cupin family protein
MARPMKRFLYLLTSPLAVAAATIAMVPATGTMAEATATEQSVPPHTHEATDDGEIEFGPAPDVFPAGAEMAVLQGDPGAEGDLFTVRLRFPDDYVLPPHWHPTDEHVTVISGTLLVGLGDTFDEAALLPPLEAGDFITAPANANHYATVIGVTDVQVHAVGPFALTYVNPEDDPR